MSGVDLAGGRDLGGQRVAVRKFTTYPAASIEAVEGRVMPGGPDVHIRIILAAEGEVLQFPCDKRFLRALGRQCSKLGGVAQAALEEREQ